jgi:hypothetical protein
MPSAERAIEDRVRGRVVAADLVHERLVVGLAEGHRAQAQGRDLHAGGSEVAVFHAATRAHRAGAVEMTTRSRRDRAPVGSPRWYGRSRWRASGL